MTTTDRLRRSHAPAISLLPLIDCILQADAWEDTVADQPAGLGDVSGIRAWRMSQEWGWKGRIVVNCTPEIRFRTRTGHITIQDVATDEQIDQLVADVPQNQVQLMYDPAWFKT